MSTMPPSGASTRAAALASRSAKSTVIGCSPTSPRMPSVPKKLRPIADSFVAHRCDDLHGIARGSHIVNAQYARALERRDGGKCDAARKPRIHFAPRERAEHGFARQTD